VALIRDRFNLYYVGAFLVDEKNKWAELRAGTGEAGRLQLKKKHRLKIGGESMIGWSIHHRQPRIALDMGQDAVHFQNPDLADTRSEMALPLIYRNQAIGALTVQSSEPAAFSREDIIFLQTMANQLANAIENARLYSQAQQEITERKRIEEALRASETKYRQLVENANSIILRINTEGKITFFNEFAQRFFGFSDQEIVGQPVLGTIVPEFDSTGRDLTAMFEDIFEHPDNYSSNDNENITRTGERVWVSWANKAIVDEKGQVTEILCIGNDSTERKQAEQEILRRNKDLAAINHVTTSIASMLDLEAILQATARELVQVFDARNCGIALLNPAETELTVVTDYSQSAEEPAAKGTKIPLVGNMSSQQVIESGRSVVVPDAQTNPLTEPIHDLLRERRTECLMIVPLRVRGEVIGTFGIDTTEAERVFLPEEVTLAETIAGQVASAIENARLFEQMQETLTELEEAEQENRQLLTQAQHRSELLQTAAEVSRASSSILDVDDLINTSVNLIRDHFDFYYVGLFLVDEVREWAVLRAGTGEAGRIQLDNNHQLEVGGESMIGWSVQQRKARIALDVGEDAVHFRNPILPETRSEMALPLMSRETAIGALTVQSVEREAFSDEDIVLLQTMADQLANALANAGLFEQATQAHKEAESRLRETQALQQFSQRLAATLEVGEILDIFFEACTEEIGFEYVQFSLVDKTQHRIRAIAGIGLPDSQIKRSNHSHSLDSDDIMVSIVKSGETEIISGWDDRFDEDTFKAEGHADWMRIFTPITLRQENIGLVEAGFNQNDQATVSDSQVRMLRAFINQTALALDNAQRYEASQKAARREALIKEITTKVRASNDLDTILQTTVKEVADALGRTRTFIQLLSQPGSNSDPSTGIGRTTVIHAEAERPSNGGQGA
jgi:PAS domain S-box-containing protein